MPMRDITGEQFGKLTARWPVGKNDQCRVMWLCSCDCGGLSLVSGHNLVTGNTMACGCRRETQGGRSYSREYAAFMAARSRCVNKNLPYYPYWGGRGIEFRFTSFQEFLASVGPRPSAKYSLDRINNEGHYEAGNVRWATAKEQSANRRKKEIKSAE